MVKYYSLQSKKNVISDNLTLSAIVPSDGLSLIVQGQTIHSVENQNLMQSMSHLDLLGDRHLQHENMHFFIEFRLF